MPTKKNARSATTKQAPPTEQRTEKSPPQASPVFGTPGEEFIGSWVKFAEDLGETATETIRRFGEEQQREYEKWVATTKEAARPRPTETDVKEVAARFQQWTEMADEVGRKIVDAMTTGVNTQKDLFEAWSRTASVTPRSPEQQGRETVELFQKFWTDLFGTLFERYAQSFRPEFKFDDFVQRQEGALKDFGENFRKLSYSYLTSPSFVTLFGKTLDSTLEAQRAIAENGGLASFAGGIPTKKDIAELQETLRNLSEKVDRLGEKIR